MSPQLAPSLPELPAMELKPPRGVDQVGIYKSPLGEADPHHGKIIYEEETVDLQATIESSYEHDKDGNRVPDPMDPRRAKVKVRRHPGTGEEMWVKHPTTGAPQYPVLDHKIVKAKRQFVLTGKQVSRSVAKVYHFQPTAAEIADTARREREASFLTDFVKLASEAGLTPEEVIARVIADVSDSTGLPEDAVGITEDDVADALAEVEIDEIEVSRVTTVEDKPKRKPRKKKGG